MTGFGLENVFSSIRHSGQHPSQNQKDTSKSHPIENYFPPERLNNGASEALYQSLNWRNLGNAAWFARFQNSAHAHHFVFIIFHVRRHKAQYENSAWGGGGSEQPKSISLWDSNI